NRTSYSFIFNHPPLAQTFFRIEGRRSKVHPRNRKPNRILPSAHKYRIFLQGPFHSLLLHPGRQSAFPGSFDFIIDGPIIQGDGEESAPTESLPQFFCFIAVRFFGGHKAEPVDKHESFLSFFRPFFRSLIYFLGPSFHLFRLDLLNNETAFPNNSQNFRPNIFRPLHLIFTPKKLREFFLFHSGPPSCLSS